MSPNGSGGNSRCPFRLLLLLEIRCFLASSWCCPQRLRYNLACYECRLGRLEQAKNWLQKAFEVGDPKNLCYG